MPVIGSWTCDLSHYYEPDLKLKVERLLDKADKQRIGTDIEKVQFRWPVSTPLDRKLETDLWEVRSNLRQKRIARVLFTVADNEMALLHGFIKKTQKTPQKDLRLARKRRRIWEKGREV